MKLREAQHIGTDVKVLETSTAAKPLNSPRVFSREPSGQELAERARSFVSTVMSAWSGTNSTALAALGTVYAGEVDYFGKRLSRDEVLADKRRFTERWPRRTYKVQSSYAECNVSKCFVDGYLGWEAQSTARNIMVSGNGGFNYVLEPSGDTFVIVGENGRVLQRRRQTDPPRR
jgi:hypothetical protein